MLTYLHIRDFTIIDDIELNLSAGFTVLTGETGAGKSIIVDAIMQLLGRSATEDLIRTGAEKAILEATFDLTNTPLPLELAEFLDGATELVVSKTIFRGKPAQIRFNGQIITQKLCREWTSCFIQISGQHDSLNLLQSAFQLGTLDAWASPEINPIYDAYFLQYHKYVQLEQELHQLTAQANDLDQRKTFLQFQLDELSGQAFTRGEEDTLLNAKSQSKNQERLRQLYQELDSALSTISDQGRLISQLQQRYADAVELSELGHFADATATASTDHLNQIVKLRQALEMGSQMDIDDIESRLDTIFKAKTKFRVNSLEALLDLQESLQIQYDALQHSEENLVKLTEQRAECVAQLSKYAEQLHHIRYEKANIIEPQITTHLQDLGLLSARFKIQLDRSQSYTETGLTTCEFQVNFNPGEPLKPLQKVTSGGELSRLMLAIQAIQSQGAVSTLIFDEIDTGVGGITALAVGEKLAHLAQRHQVIAITHLAQVAKYANQHFVVHKTPGEKSTHVSIKALSEAEVKTELHRMVGGESVLSVIR